MGDTTDLAQDANGAATAPGEALRPRWSRRRRLAIASGGFLALALAATWIARDRIADQVIGNALQDLELPATYEIDTIGPGVQILRNIVVGDPRHPDMTIDRAELRLAYGLSLPEIGEVVLVNPKIYGSYRENRLSFGALDKVLFEGPSTAPFRLPKFNLVISGGQGVLETDMGRVDIKAEGRGRLHNGFAGTLQAAAPDLRIGGCTMHGARLAGAVTVTGEKPRFTGPLQATNLACPAQGITLARGVMNLDTILDKDFKGVVSKHIFRSENVSIGDTHAESLALDSALSWRDGALSGRVAANAGGLRWSGATVGLFSLDGRISTREKLSSLEFRGSVDGQGLRRGPVFDRALASTEIKANGTLFAPMLAQVRAALAREERGSRFGGDLSVRKHGDAWSLVIPSASLRGGSGQALLSLSRFQLARSGAGAPRMAGAFSTAGAGLPRINGRLEDSVPGRAVFRVAMQPYRAGRGSLAVPALMIAQVADGSLGFSGMAQASGDIPGGYVQNLMLPVQGSYSARGELALWKRCITPSFDRIAMGQVVLDQRRLTICPAGGTAIVRNGAAGLHVAGGVAALDLSGRLGETPIRLSSGPIGLAWPGTLSAARVDVALGPDESATHFKLDEVVARLGREYAGTFNGVEARLAAVPLDLTGAKGDWRFADGTLTLADAQFALSDRSNPARFEPLAASGATLTLADNRIDARAVLHNPESAREVARAVIRHDLGNSTGHADIDVPALLFDKDLQPDQLTRLALGVVANVAGTVKGGGRIDWSQRGVTSTGAFGSDNLDLAAAFGPVKGLSGQLVFTDLLGLVTAPHQRLKIASVNPGIEVNDGVVDLQLLPELLLRLNTAFWPFLGGTLTMEPTELRLGMAETRRYTLAVEGLDAAKFLERMEIGNLSATGIFDGRLPLVFDAEGGRIAGGMLVARPPGGNVSYVGALTYKDLSPMANYAFDQLKSLDYKRMTIAMKGDLEGEIVTNVKFAGVKQGTGVKRNFITKQLANLPIQFNVNIRAPFYQLITSVKAMYDPAFIKDPRTLGLVDAMGRPVKRLSSAPGPAGIQPPASGTMP